MSGQTLTPVADPTSFATVIQIKGQAEEFKTVAQVLSETAGIQVRRFGGLGDFATVSVRGSSSGQVRFYLDEVPLTRARTDTVNVADLPLEPLDRIEVFRGTTPISVGASALGGVINLVSRDPSDTPEVDFLAGGGSFSTRQASLTASGRIGDWGLLGSVNYLGSKGDFPFYDDNGTDQNPLDDERVRRENNAFDATSFLLKAVRELSPRSRIVALNDFFVNDQGVPGIGAFQSRDANLFDLRNLSYLRWSADGADGLPDEIDATLFFAYEEERFEDLQGDGEINLQASHSRLRTFASGANLHAAQSLGAHLLEARIDLGGEVLLPRNLLDPDPDQSSQSRFTLGVAAGDTIALLEGNLLLDGQLRYEFAHDEFGGFKSPADDVIQEASSDGFHLFTPRLGARYTALPELWLKANAGRYGRFPSFAELFSNRGALVGNPDLRPEEGWNVDVGLETRQQALGPMTGLRAEAALFWRDVDDLIVLVKTTPNTSKPSNVGRATIFGVELAASFELWDSIGVTANYTYQNARDESPAPSRNGKRLPGVAPSELYARLDYRAFDLVPFYEVSFTSANYLDPSNRREVPSRTLHNLGLQYRAPSLPLTLTFDTRNLGDNQVADFAGFPLPGRSFFGTVSWRWAEKRNQES